jgi:hypothetical protein
MSEIVLTDPLEILYRQINPHFLLEGEFTSQIFEVTPKDNGELSIDQGTRASAKEAFDRFMSQDGVNSVGVTHVTVADCTDVDLQAIDKPSALNPAHGFVDFRGVPARKAQKKKARHLKIAAIAYGWDYQAIPNESSSR